MIDPDPFPMKLGGDPAIAITVVVFDQILDPFDQEGFIWFVLFALIVGNYWGEPYESATPLDTLAKVSVLGEELPSFCTREGLLCIALFNHSFSRVGLPTNCFGGSMLACT